MVKDFAVVDLRDPALGFVQVLLPSVIYVHFGRGYQTARMAMRGRQKDVLVQGNSALRQMASNLRAYGL